MAMDERASRAPHLVTTATLVDYELVVPTYRRWRSTQEATFFIAFPLAFSSFPWNFNSFPTHFICVFFSDFTMFYLIFMDSPW